MADNVHIEGISDTVAHVRANADAKQSGKFTDNSDTSARTYRDRAGRDVVGYEHRQDGRVGPRRLQTDQRR